MENIDVKNYLDYLKYNKNYSDNTILNYQKDIKFYKEDLRLRLY